MTSIQPGSFEASWGEYGAEEVGTALRRGLEQVRNGTPAIIAAKITTAIQEMSL